MTQAKKDPVLLMVDDDDEDIYLTKRAFCHQQDDLIFKSVHSGSEMFDYLYCRGKFEHNDALLQPDVILLDINIPRENGFTTLEKLRADERFSNLPVSMLTTSSATHDIQKAYQLGANSYICKSVSAQGMEDVAQHFCGYWFRFAKLPIAA